MKFPVRFSCSKTVQMGQNLTFSKRMYIAPLYLLRDSWNSLSLIGQNKEITKASYRDFKEALYAHLCIAFGNAREII
jgi:hypothetical protein